MNSCNQEQYINCPGCGLRGQEIDIASHPYIGASTYCWNVYSKILEREYSNPEYMKVHRLTVDAYCTQHPGVPSRKSIQSVNVHLVGLYLVLERGDQGVFARKIIGTIANSFGNELTWHQPPSSLGKLLVSDVLKACTAEEHSSLVTSWANDVWSSWSSVHETIIELTERAIKICS